MAQVTTTNNKDIGTQTAEQGLLSCLFYKPDKIVEIIDELNPELFSVKEFSIIYKCISDLWKEDIIPDEVTVINRAANLGHNLTPELVKKLANGTTFSAKRQLKKYAEIIRASAFKRKTITLCEGFLENAKNMGSPEKIIGEFLTLAMDMQDKVRTNSTAKEIYSDEKKLIENIDFRFDNPDYITGLPTGYSELDEYADGFRDGEVITITGQNSSGKSYAMQCIMVNQAYYLLKNKIDKKLFLQTPEMTHSQVVNRCIEIVSGIDAKYLAKPRLFFVDKGQNPTKEGFEKFKDHIKRANDIVNKLPIVIDDFSGPSALDSINNIKKFHLKYGLACAYMDYADLFENEGFDDYKNQYQSYRIWKKGAKDMQIPIVIVNQYLKDLKLNKADGYRGTMQNISGGKAAMNDSHLILHVYRPEVFVDYINDHPEKRGKTYLYSDKMRDRWFGSTMPDVEFQKQNGILRQTSDILRENQKVVSGLENFS